MKSQQRSIDYNYLYPKIIEITQNNIYSEKVLQTDEWKEFQKELKETLNKVQDDIELYLGFKMLSQNLPFSHYYLFIRETTGKEGKNSNADNVGKKIPTVIYEKKDEHTAYLKIKNFSSSQKELAQILPKIVKDDPKNLIVDLRGNSGGGVEAAFEFAKYIVNDTVNVGYFVTNRLQYTGFNADLFKTLPVAVPETTAEFIETLKNGKGAKLVFNNPGIPVYSGNIFVLTNGGCGSTCEPVVYMLKKSKKATIIGETTAGAMLSGTLFNISGKYNLFLPIADFYTHDGVRLEGVGVAPEIETNSENALEKALSIINNQE
jgi:C-terminal processing protease CtpA/Prc